jgi:hypothetical protein
MPPAQPNDNTGNQNKQREHDCQHNRYPVHLVYGYGEMPGADGFVLYENDVLTPRKLVKQIQHVLGVGKICDAKERLAD